MAGIPVCSGDQITQHWERLVSCEYADGSAAPWVMQETFSISDLDNSVASAAYASGFVIVGTAWAIGWGCRAVLNLLRR